MNTLSEALHGLLPLIGAVLLVIGIKIERVNYIIAALWLSLIALFLHYQTAGGEILGSYFGYKNAAIYTLNILVLMVTLLYLFFKLPLLQSKLPRYVTGIISAILIVGSLLLLTNLWVNARFIENRRPGTPVLQVATFTPLDYCAYRYVFYKVGVDGKISYMCPNYYGIIPSVGHLEVLPYVVLNHLTQHMKAKNTATSSGQ